MADPTLFKHYLLVQDADGNNVELVRNAEQVAVLAFDTKRHEFVHCHVLLEPLANRAAFEQNATKLQHNGHPLMARLVDCGEDDGNPFYITSNVDGEPLDSYLGRQQDLPVWLALMLACRSLDAAATLCERGDFLPGNPLGSLRLLQSGPQHLLVMAADYQLRPAGAVRKKALSTALDKQAKFLRNFLAEWTSGTAGRAMPVADFTELLTACLEGAGAGTLPVLQDLHASLREMDPPSTPVEIPTAHKPRAVVAPLLASYQEVARTMVNLVRIQSQRLDTANPYAMRGTLTKTGRPVMVEQVPPARLCGAVVEDMDRKALKVCKKRDFSSLVTLPLVHQGDGITCLAEEVVEGINLADLLRERGHLDVHEAYLVLAGLDAALGQLEASGLETRRLRLEDLFVLTGFPREDARAVRLLKSRLNEWPAFSLMVRAHPSLASLSGRGVDPSVLLGRAGLEAGAWHGGWMAAACKYLLALEAIPGAGPQPARSNRERETVERLLSDEIQHCIDGSPSKRADFLGRYARVVQHHDLVKPAPAAREPEQEVLPPKPSRIVRTIAAPQPVLAPAALTSGIAPVGGTERPSIGFAEALFTGTGQVSTSGENDWVKTAIDAPPTLREALLPPSDYVPMWLRASVFIGGSLVLGAFFAHLSGNALWQKKQVIHARSPASAASLTASRPTETPAAAAVARPAPTAPVAVETPRSVPVAMPVAPVPELPPEPPATTGGANLLKPPPALPLRDPYFRPEKAPQSVPPPP